MNRKESSRSWFSQIYEYEFRVFLESSTPWFSWGGAQDLNRPFYRIVARYNVKDYRCGNSYHFDFVKEHVFGDVALHQNDAKRRRTSISNAMERVYLNLTLHQLIIR